MVSCNVYNKKKTPTLSPPRSSPRQQLHNSSTPLVPWMPSFQYVLWQHCLYAFFTVKALCCLKVCTFLKVWPSTQQGPKTVSCLTRCPPDPQVLCCWAAFQPASRLPAASVSPSSFCLSHSPAKPAFAGCRGLLTQHKPRSPSPGSWETAVSPPHVTKEGPSHRALHVIGTYGAVCESPKAAQFLPLYIDLVYSYHLKSEIRLRFGAS